MWRRARRFLENAEHWKYFSSFKDLKLPQIPGSGKFFRGELQITIRKFWINFVWRARWDGDGFRRILQVLKMRTASTGAWCLRALRQFHFLCARMRSG